MTELCELLESAQAEIRDLKEQILYIKSTDGYDNYVRLMHERDQLRDDWNDLVQECKSLKAENDALRSDWSKLKRECDDLKAERQSVRDLEVEVRDLLTHGNSILAKLRMDEDE